jgi:hypothetical protein
VSDNNPSGREMTVSAGSLLAVFLAKSAGPAAPFVAVAINPLTTRMAQKVDAELRRKSNVIAETAVRTSELDDPGEFCEALIGTPEMIALTQKILWAASVTGYERKLRALGALLGMAVKPGGNRLDETNLLADALADLEEPHVVVMNVIAAPAADPEGRVGWLASQVQAEVAMEPDFVLAILNTLTRHGLAITEQNNYGAVPRFELTNFGRALADHMKRAAGEPGEDAAERFAPAPRPPAQA